MARPPPHSQYQGRPGHVTVAAPSAVCPHPSTVARTTELDLVLQIQFSRVKFVSAIGADY